MEKLTIYVIYHSELEDTNVFTTDKNKIFELIEKMKNEYKDTDGEWKYRTLVEGELFDADMGSF